MKLRNIFLILVVVLSTIGTSATPTKAQSACIEVASAADLDAIRGYTDGNYCLTADIDLASYSNWLPIPSFFGTIDGQGHHITNLTIDNSGGSAGLFADFHGTASNLAIEDASVISDGDQVGIFAGYLLGAYVYNIQVQGSVQGNTMVGALAGESYASIILNIAAHGNVTGQNLLGGIIGKMDSGSILKYSYASVQVAPPATTNYLSFDGINDYIEIPHNNAYTVGNFSIEAWFKWDMAGTDNVSFVISKGYEYFDVHTGGNSGINGLRFIPVPQYTTTYNDERAYQDVPNVLDSTWHHVALVWDFENNQTQMLVDGERREIYQANIPAGLIASLPLANPSINPLAANTNSFFIGARNNGNGYFSYPFHGQIADVRVWNRARTPAEIKADMNRQLKGTESGLIGYWRLDESSGEVAYDNSSYENNGTINGATRVNTSQNGPITAVPYSNISNCYYETDVALVAPNNMGTPLSGADMRKQASFAGFSFGDTWQIDEGKTYPSIVTFTPTTSVDSVSKSSTVIDEAYTVAYSVSTTSYIGSVSGNVTVSDGNASCTASIATGSCSLSSTSSGSKKVFATFTGSDVFAEAASTSVDHTVTKKTATVGTPTESLDPTITGMAYTVSATIGGSTPTGTVTFSDGTDSCTGTISGGSASCSLTSSTTGDKTITATYNGDSIFSTASNTTSHKVSKANTTTTITADTPDPSVVNSGTTVTVSVVAVAPGGGTPTGTVSIDDQTYSCSATLSAGTGSCTVTSRTSGNKTFTATYHGDDNYIASYDTEAHVVGKIPTKVTITNHSPSPSVFGNSYSIDFKVEPQTGTATDITGNVSLSDGTNTSQTTLSSQAGSLSVTGAAVGDLTWTISYLGSSTYAASSTTVDHTVSKGTTAVTVSPVCTGGCKAGIAYEVTYSVSAVTGTGTPTGSISVSDGTDSCSGALGATGSGSCYLTSAASGSKTLTATYDGDTNFGGSSNTASVSLAKTTPTISFLKNSPNPSVPGQQYEIGISAGGNAGDLANDITISDGTSSCEVTLTSSLGSCFLTTATAGSKTITASYAGDDKYNSTSNTATHTVNKGNSSIAIISRSPESTIPGQAYTVGVRVSKALPDGADITGTVTISTSYDSCTVTLSAGEGSCELTDTTAGNSTFSAQYNGDDNYYTSTTSATQVVSPASSTVTLESDINPAALGESVSLSVTVTLDAPATDTATGSVAVLNGETTLCTITLTDGAGDCDISNFANGDHALYAEYTPDTANVDGSSSTTLTQIIREISLSDDLTSTSHTTVGALSTTNGSEPTTYVLATSGRICDATNGANNNLFEISGSNLALMAGSAAGTYDVCITGTGADGGAIQKALTVTVNDPPSLSESSLSNSEGTTSHSEVGTITLNGGRDPQELTFASSGAVCNDLNSQHNSKFSLSGLDLTRKTNTLGGSYYICLQVEDAEGDIAQYAYTISVFSAPTDLTLSSTSVSGAQSEVGSFSQTGGEGPFSYKFSTDGDTCTATNGADNGAFEIVGNVLNRLSATPVGEYAICVTAEDAHSGHTSQAFTITVTAPLSGLELSKQTVNIGEALVGSFSNNGGSAPFSFTLANTGEICSPAHNTANALFDIPTGSKRLILKDGATAGNHKICVQATDGNDETSQAEFEISVSEQNGGTLDFSLSSHTIIDGDNAGTVVGTLRSVTSGVTYELVDTDLLPDGLSFAINTYNELTIAEPAAKDTKPTYLIRIRATDPLGNTMVRDLQISVLGTAASAGGSAKPDQATTAAGAEMRLDVLENDILSTGATHWGSFDIVIFPRNGIARIGSIIYKPNPGFTGKDNVTYRACDDTHLCVYGSVGFTVLPNESDLEAAALLAGKTLPETGFAPGMASTFEPVSDAVPLTELGEVSISIPKLLVETKVVGVTAGTDSWNLAWLGAQAGWLDGSAFPGWVGNSVITGHNVGSNGKPGVFAGLKWLAFGDVFTVSSYGNTYTYIVRENRLILPSAAGSAFEHKEQTSWVTLLTCEDYDQQSGTYTYRRMVRAQLVSVR